MKTEHRGAAAALTSITVDDALPPGAQLVGGSVQTSVPGRVTADGAGLHIGPMAAAVDRSIEIRYRFRAGALGAVGYVGDGSARLVYNDAYTSARLRLPRAPLDVAGGASALPGCTPNTAKTAWEPSVVQGQDVHVAVAFDTVCVNASRKQDLVLVVDSSRAATADQLATIRGAIRNLLFNVGGQDIHAALVTMDWRIRRVMLSGNLDRVLDRLDDLGDVTGGGFGEPNIAAGLNAAADELSWRRPDAHAGIVLLSNGYGNPAPMLAAAAALKADGVQIATACFDTVCDPALAGIPNDPADHHVVRPAQLEALLGALARRFGSVRIERAVLTETLAPDMAFVDGSADPPPDRVDGGRLMWTIVARPGAADEVVRYAVRPLSVGADRPLGPPADLAFTDEIGRASTARPASPSVTVFPPGQDGPCEPDLRREPRRLDGVVGDPVRYTLSAALTCPPTTAELDVVLVVDHSDSMASQSRLTNAVAAALGFLADVPAGPRVGLVTFSSDVTAALPLSADFTAVRDALGRLEANGRTAITRALRAAETLLEQRRPDAQGAIVLLTDGREQAGSVPAMLAAAARIKGAGTRIVTVCAGDCDPELAAVASGPSDALTIADSAALVGIFKALAADLGSVQPTDIRILEGYTQGNVPRRGDFIPQPAAGDGVAEAIWTFDRLPRGRPQLVQVVLEPQAAGVGDATRFARLGYRFGRRSGYAYFPSGFIDTPRPHRHAADVDADGDAPADPNARADRDAALEVAPRGARVVWLPWGAR
ncbi:MAG: VWA domain-containing protein [Anaerolineae bacterium]